MNDDPFAQERLGRRQRSPFLGRQAFVPTPEDVVVMKLRWALSDMPRRKPIFMRIATRGCSTGSVAPSDVGGSV